MSKIQLINGFRQYLESSQSDSIKIPEERIEDFWDWFSRKSKIFLNNNIKRNLWNPDVPIDNNSCYKNSYRIAKAFKKRLLYYEGFAFRNMDSLYIKHAFNVNNFSKIHDYSLNSITNEDINDNFNCYVGVCIPLNFVKKIYFNRDGVYTQYTVLVARFMFENQLENHIEYTSI